MNLYAYTQIDDLEKVAKENNIDIPRLRGYEWMENEEPYTKEYILDCIRRREIDIVEDLCRSSGWNPYCCCHSYNYKTDKKVKYYIDKDEDGNKTIRWDRIHGKKRKILKLAIKKKEKQIREQIDTYNKYAGMKNILYVHARIGGNNWKYLHEEYKKAILNHPGFLAGVDFAYDNTYCDFYFRVKEQ